MSIFFLKLIAIFFSSLIFFQSYITKKLVGTYIIPAAMFSVIWFLYTIIPLLILPTIQINPLSVLYIFICSFSFGISALPFNWKKAFAKNKSKKEKVYCTFNSSFLRYIFYTSCILAFVFSTLIMITNGFSMALLMSNLLETSGLYAAMRGHEELDYGLLGVLSIFFTYFTPMLGAIVVEFSSERVVRRRFLLFLSFAPSLYCMITQSTKLALLVAIIFYLATTLVMKIYANKLVLFNFKSILKKSVYIFILLPLISISFLSRQGNSNFSDQKEALGIIKYSLNTYAFAQIYAFSDFFSFTVGMKSETSYKDDYNSYGYYTFKSIFDSFGGKKKFPPGYFEESYYVKDVFETNVFTVFRSLIYDFGLIGTIFFFFLFGLFVHFFFYRLLFLNNSWISVTIFIISMVFIMLSYLFSIFTARYIFLLGAGFFLVLLSNGYLSRPKKIS
ncbi:MAG: oligosaccharide repeat unit polymerase [Bacteroidota bacterium]|nr:oligosaccharide repeat unit polymerase [Bacteroidota bacterium]